MEDLQDAVSQPLDSESVTLARNLTASLHTCSHDVLMKTGGPSSNFLNTGTSFFKNTV